ncbi:MAG: polysaccharide deacetylase family protein [Sandaracinaceae bacterium]|nr:polysaccharide deacetylase family protein [Sandaracinaceae bacterium]MBX3276259.1 polysaccharide deacetylase family protein [Sandaracinaceae bacterium]
MTAAFTLDLEDHTGAYAPRGRHIDVARRILDWCDAQDIRGTVFVVGRLAASAPELVRELAARGHEVACHSWSHEPLGQLGPEGFRADTLRAKALLEDVAQHRVVGYRAPIFSLTRATPWAPDVLREAGFEYSSSVMPAPNPLHGFPEAPAHPFRWPSGLVELPCPVRRIGPLTVPYLGGVYLRYLPLRLVERWASRADGTVLWTYCHPYDFDADEPYTRIAGASTPTSVLLWLNRRGTWGRVGALAAGSRVTMAEVASRMQDLTTWSPSIS